jgi:uncharacterized membrane protein
MTTGDGFLARRRRYRRLMFGVLGAGVLGFVVAGELGYDLVGVGIYWAGILGFVAIWQGTETTLQDERERAIEQWASTVTLLVTAVALVTLGPALGVLDDAGIYDSPTVVDGALLGYALLFGVFGVLYLARRVRP